MKRQLAMERKPKMDMDGEKREALRSMWERLTPEERRGRFAIRAGFRNAANEALQLDRFFPVPAYVWEKWCPLLGVLPVAVYLELRRMCFVDRATGERRVTCWPKQETIARRLGVKKRHTISAALRLLEEHGFISRERTHYNEEATGRIRRGVTAYTVWWEPPLVVQDAVSVLLKEMEQEATEPSAQSLMAEKRPFGAEPVENSALGPKNGHAYRAEKRPSELIPRNKPNVTNVRSITSTKPKLRELPEVRGMSSQERERREALVLELGERLKSWGGGFDGGRHGSEGFHRRAAFLMPEVFVREALMATGDAVQRRMAGGEGPGDPSRYFGGVIQNIAAREGIDLGVRSAKVPAAAAGTPREVPRSPASRSAEEPEPSPEERARVKKFLAELTAKWSAEDPTAKRT